MRDTNRSREPGSDVAAARRHRHGFPTCTVCRAASTRLFSVLGGRVYWRCGRCEATILDPVHWPGSEAELAEYRLHRNDVRDPYYRKFLSRLADPLLEQLPPNSTGLDYGCGPEPMLARMLRDAGHEMALFDPYFLADPETLRRTYDFITCSEVAEHFHRPADEFDRFEALLRPGAWLAVMTCFQTDDARFAAWHYRRDPTHVVFYREATLRHLAAQRGWTCRIPRKDVALMRKPRALGQAG